ncbi:MAG: metal-sensing transcriptional repressor [Thiopseudomonas sp.]
MSHTQKEKKALLNRVRRLRGQLDGLERALEEEQGCYEVLQGHIRDHMQPLAAEGEPEATEGLIKVLRSYLK